jgi:exopolysaccharide production protein ExoZ
VLNNIQNLRALAAYAVVVYHCLIRFLHPTDPLGRSYLDLLSGGVDLFFIISGFVMVHTTRADETPAWFVTKRIARIVPLYWLATLVVIVLVIVRPWTFSQAMLTPEAILSSLFFVPHADASGQAYPILGVGWTLNYEMMFYALFALSMVLHGAYRLVGLVVLITLVWALASLSGDGLVARFYANPILFEFAAGCLLAYALRTDWLAAFVRRTPMWPFALLGLAGFALLPAIIPLGQPSILRYVAPAFLLVFAAAAQDLYRRPAIETLATRLGDASYSAYVLHPIIIVIVAQVVIASLGEGLAAELVLMAAVLVATALVSLLSMRVFEKPAAAWLRGLAGRLRPVGGGQGH